MNKWARGGLIALGGLVALGIINNLVAPPDDEAAVTATTMPSLTDEGQQGSAGATGSQGSQGAQGATVTVGDGPNGVGFDGSNIWVANSGDDTASKIVP